MKCSVDQSWFGTPIDQLANYNYKIRDYQNLEFQENSDKNDEITNCDPYSNYNLINDEANSGSDGMQITNKYKDEAQNIYCNIQLNYDLNNFPKIVLEPSIDNIFLVDFEELKNGKIVSSPSYWTEPYFQEYNKICMPCSKYNEIIIHNRKDKRWDLIINSITELKDGTFSPTKFQDVLKKYHKTKLHFDCLFGYWNYKDKSSKSEISEIIVPKIVDLVLHTEIICTQPIPLLLEGIEKKLSISKRQAACILANAFFCTFPKKNYYTKLPRFNFNRLFGIINESSKEKSRFAKLDCIFNYFNRYNDKVDGLLTFHRHVMQPVILNDWLESDSKLSKLHISTNGTIETQGRGMLQVDFANKYVGGGVLHNGCVQEEIRFLISPEAIVSLLFTECLNDNECLHMIGCEQYSDYKGYASNFEFAGNYQDDISSDTYQRKQVEIVAIDALPFYNYLSQFSENNLVRELNKALCGFTSSEGVPIPIATGNWGCGAFNGDLQLKAIIQLMAASSAERDICYFTFGNYELAKSFHEIHQLLVSKKSTVGQIMKILICFGMYLKDEVAAEYELFKYIVNYLNE